MESFIQDIDKRISDCNNNINDKILGTNYLEMFKFQFIDSIKKNNLLFNLNIPDFEISKKFGNNNLLFKIQAYKDPSSRIRNTLLENQLSIVLKGFKFIKIFQDIKTKVSVPFNLYKNTGIVLTKNTIISESFSQETVLLDIIDSPDEGYAKV